jgi:hypothetical protein
MTHEGYEVVLTERRERNVADHDHLVVADLKGHAQVLAGIGLDAFEEFDVHVSDATRRLYESFTRRVFANGF